MRYSPSAIRQFIHEQATGRHTVAAFCVAHQLKVSTFYAWRKKYVEPEASLGEVGFCQIRASAVAVGRSLVLPSGLQVNVDGLSMSELAELVIKIDRANA